MKAAGLDREELRKERWARRSEKIAELIRRLHGQGKSLRTRDMLARRLSGLVCMARKYFGLPWSHVVRRVLGKTPQEIEERRAKRRRRGS